MSLLLTVCHQQVALHLLLSIPQCDNALAPKSCKRKVVDPAETELIALLHRDTEMDDLDKAFFMSLCLDFKQLPDYVKLQIKMHLIQVTCESASSVPIVLPQLPDDSADSALFSVVPAKSTEPQNAVIYSLTVIEIKKCL